MRNMKNYFPVDYRVVALTKASIALTDVFNPATQSLYLSLTTPQGAPATADVYVYGRRFQQN